MARPQEEGHSDSVVVIVYLASAVLVDVCFSGVNFS